MCSCTYDRDHKLYHEARVLILLAPHIPVGVFCGRRTEKRRDPLRAVQRTANWEAVGSNKALTAARPPPPRQIANGEGERVQGLVPTRYG